MQDWLPIYFIPDDLRKRWNDPNLWLSLYSAGGGALRPSD